MSEKRKSKAKYRVVYRNEDDNHKCGTVWESPEGYLSLQPITDPNDEFGEITMEDALARMAEDGGFLNFFENKPKDKGGKKRRRTDDAEGDFE